MTPQKLWVLNAHIKTDKIDDVCQNVRQDFDIYRNIDHQKAKKLKNEGKRNKTHKETSEQTNKQTNKQRNKKTKKTNKRCRLFFFGPMQWLEPLRAAKRYK